MKLPKFEYVFEQEWLLSHCHGKSVLHLGCAGDATLEGGPESSLHIRVSKIADCLWGIELNQASLNQVKAWLPEHSDKIRYFVGNVENLKELGIQNKFDVILAGSIIEHVSNPGLMLSGIYDLMAPNGLLLISTPHTWGILQFLRVALRRTEAVNPEHVCWYSVPTLTELVSRYGFSPTEWATGYGWRPSTLRWNIQKAIGIPIFKIFPHLGGSLLGAFKKIEKQTQLERCSS